MRLTRAEEEIMQILWKIKKGFVRDILEHLPKPKLAYTTVSTIVRILQDKRFVGHKKFGRSHEYYPLISKEEYSTNHLKRFAQEYFSNSFRNMINLLIESKSISLKEMEEIVKIMRKEVMKRRLKHKK